MDANEPKISYGNITDQPIHTNAQYLLVKAGIGNGVHQPNEFLQRILAVTLDDVTKEECRRDIEVQRGFLKCMAEKGPVTIENFTPDVERINRFVSTTFEEMMEGFRRRYRQLEDQ